MIKIIAIDKIKEEYIRTGIQTFLKRLENKCKIDIVEITPAKYHLTDDMDTALKKEANLILNKINTKSYIVALDKEGTQHTSKEFSKFIYQTLNKEHITFIIGGAYGLDKQILQKANTTISFSKMTFTHEIFRLLLIEQIYRAYTIQNNIKYHH